MHDAHLHISDIAFFKEMQKHQIEGIANAASPQEYHFLKELQAQYPKLRISAGIHPWQADAITRSDVSDSARSRDPWRNRFRFRMV